MYITNTLQLVCSLPVYVCRYDEGAEKYLSLLETDDDISPFLLRIRSNLCHCYSKVHVVCDLGLAATLRNVLIKGGPGKKRNLS